MTTHANERFTVTKCYNSTFVLKDQATHLLSFLPAFVLLQCLCMCIRIFVAATADAAAISTRVMVFIHTRAASLITLCDKRPQLEHIFTIICFTLYHYSALCTALTHFVSACSSSLLFLSLLSLTHTRSLH